VSKTQHNRRPLEPNSADEVLKHIGRLWGFDVRLESVDDHGQVSKTFECKVDKAHRELLI
jgi:stage V sporulation protein R